LAAAQPVFQEAGNRLGENQLLTMWGSLHMALTGDYAQAADCFEQSRIICRSIGKRYHEAIALINAGIAQALLGQFQRSQNLLAEADEVMGRVGARFMQGVIRYWQGANHRNLCRLDQAWATTEEALAICCEVGNRNFEIESRKLLGLIALDRHDLAQAQRQFAQAVEVARAYQQTPDLVLIQAHLALVLLHQGWPHQAQQLSAEAVSTLEQLGGQFSRTKDVYYRRYQILTATAGPETARSALERAHQHLMEMAERIQDDAQRRSFLENVAIHRDIVTAHKFGRPPPRRVDVRLPRADVPTGRPLCEDDFTTVAWTVTAPEDDAIPQKVERRRHVLRRLLQEAAAQGAAPTVPDLAAALQSSPRTVKRDLAALRAAGHPTPTRGHRN
jgi:tetratricopeptide (TPR) repeat protein